MTLSLLKTGVLITRRVLLVNVILFFVFFTSYFVFSVYILRYVGSSVNNPLILQAAFHFIITITLILTSFFIHRINKVHLVYASSVATSIATLLLFLTSNELLRIVITLLIGVFFSTGQLAFFTYFWKLTSAQERGRVGGLIGFVSLPLSFVIDPIIAETLDFSGTILLGFFLSLGALVIVLLRPEKLMLTAKQPERENYSEKKTVLLYSIPWVLFSLVNVTLAKNISLNIFQQVSSSFYLFLIGLQTIGVIFGAIIGGVIADFLGRRLSLVFSLTLYGIGSALVGLVTNGVMLSLVYVANGLSWGILLIMYTFVVWGDLANNKNCARMYSIGLTTYYSSIGVGLLFTSTLQIPLVVSALASCLVVFLSNIPIALAPELLSSDFRERIKLRMHMNAVKKIKQSQNQG